MKSIQVSNSRMRDPRSIDTTIVIVSWSVLPLRVTDSSRTPPVLLPFYSRTLLVLLPYSSRTPLVLLSFHIQIIWKYVDAHSQTSRGIRTSRHQSRYLPSLFTCNLDYLTVTQPHIDLFNLIPHNLGITSDVMLLRRSGNHSFPRYSMDISRSLKTLQWFVEATKQRDRWIFCLN